MRTARKRTKFEFCQKHDGLTDIMTRREVAETFCEGGPGYVCEGGRCRVWPGTDFYVEEACYAEAILSWTQHKAPVPDSTLMRSMKRGHAQRHGHDFHGYLTSGDGETWTLVRECCEDRAVF